MAEKYILRVTAGPSYDPSTHVEVPVNGPTSTPIHSSACTAQLKVRIQDYRGLPHGSPSTAPYFSTETHHADKYSIAFSFIPRSNVSGTDLVFGNDFDRPIRDRLPPGFGTAFKIVKWAIDPGLDGDVYADKPYLYGPLLSSINELRVGEPASQKDDGYEIPVTVHEDGIEEGADGNGAQVREEAGMPEAAAERKKWALHEAARDAWQWQQGRVYCADFFNPYLDFNNFTLKLPGFSLNILGHMDEKGDTLRYVLKNKATGDVFFVVVLTLLLKEELERAEAEKKPAESVAKPLAKASTKAEGKDEEEEFEPDPDDVD